MSTVTTQSATGANSTSANQNAATKFPPLVQQFLDYLRLLARSKILSPTRSRFASFQSNLARALTSITVDSVSGFAFPLSPLHEPHVLPKLSAYPDVNVRVHDR